MICMARGDIGLRVRQAREAFPGRMRIIDLAAKLGISHARLSNWERGEHDPPPEYIERIAQTLRVNIGWLLGDAVPMIDSTASFIKPVHRAGSRIVPIYGAISAGKPEHMTSDAIEFYEMVEWGGDFERWGRVVDGWSMEPHLTAGDWAIFENRRWEPGHVVHAYRDGEDTVKQVRFINGVLTLCPTNPDYEAFDGRDWHIKGVCIALVRMEQDGGQTLRQYVHGMRPRTHA
jgi:transcriptional regulator with XRE-family HTH domain